MRRPRAISVVSILLSLIALPAAGLDIAGWDRAMADVSLGRGVPVAKKQLTWGHLELLAGAGTLYQVRVGDRTVGVFFRGEGSFRYVSTDPQEAAVYRTNVARTTSYEVDQKGAIGDTIEEALIFISDGADALADWAGAAPADGNGAVAFAQHVKRFAQDQGRRARHLLPQALVDPPAQPVVVAEIVAAKHDIHWALDPLRERDEWIAVMRETHSKEKVFKDKRYPDSLSRQLLGRTRLDPEPQRFVVAAADLTLVNPDGPRADIEVAETLVALEPLRTLAFNLWNRRVVTTGATGRLDERDYTLAEVTTAEGEKLPFAHHEGGLVVELPRPLARGQRVTLRFRLSGDILYRPENMSYWELPSGSAWIPLPAWEAQSIAYHAVVKVKSPFTPFSVGRTVRRWQEDGLECAEFRADKPVQVPVILAGSYSTYSEERNGITVNVSSYVRAEEKAKKKLAALAFTFLDFYRGYLGDYPLGELNLIEIDSYGWGQSPQGVVFITKEAFQPLQDAYARFYSEGVNARLAHEIAHAWWGHVSKLSSQHQWLSEATAEYYAAHAMGELKGAAEFKQALGLWRGQSSFVKDKASILTANELSGLKAWEADDRVALLYGKGPLVLHALRQEVGDEAFFTILKSYLRSFEYKNANTAQFIALTSYVAKRDMSAWFQRYLLGTEWPKT